MMRISGLFSLSDWAQHFVVEFNKGLDIVVTAWSILLTTEQAYY